jgi:hypothetical protein
MTLVTYHLTSDFNGKLQRTAKIACGFWNRFLEPNTNVVIRLGKFTSFGSTIARAFEPYSRDGVTYGRVEFNTNFLKRYKDQDIAGTIIHEIGHTLGIGWEKWKTLFSPSSGKFYKKYINMIPELQDMIVETDYGPGTTLSHWDEETFDKELMSGFKDENEYVLPVTIRVMSLLGHQVIEDLTKKTPLIDIINELTGLVFTRQQEASSFNRDVLIETDICDEIYDLNRVKNLDP